MAQGVSDRAGLVLAFPDYADAARRLAQAARLDYAELAIHRFPDGESLVRVPVPLPAHVVVCLCLDHPNSKLIDLELAAATARELGAERLTLVASYLCYMRQDRAFHPGEAVSQRIIGRLLARHFDTLITVDPHLHRTPALADAVPVPQAIALSATAAMADWLSRAGGAPLLLGPDEESEQWVSAIAASAGLEHGVASKTRLGDRRVEVVLPPLDFAHREVVLVDDVVSTGHTMAECARLLKRRGAARVSALVTHALFVDDALSMLRQAGVETIVSTDSVPHPSNGIELAEVLAQALSR